MDRKEIDGILAQARAMDAQRAAFDHAKAVECPQCRGECYLFVNAAGRELATPHTCPTCEGRGEVSEHYECPCLSGRVGLCPQHGGGAL